MKFVFAFLSIYLAVTGFAAQTQASLAASEAATREAIASLKRVASTKLGKTLLDTIQIELKANSGSDPIPTIVRLLNEILDDTNGQIQAYNDHIDAVRQDCETTKASLNQQLNNLEEAIADATAIQSSTSAELITLGASLSSNSGLLASLQVQLSDLVATREQRKAAHDKENARLQKIRSVLDQTKGFIADRLDQRNPSFLQKNNILVEVKRRVMTPEFQSMSAGWGKFINFLATKALEKIRQNPDESAIDALQRIISVINDVLERINELINNGNAAEISEQASFEVNSEQLNINIQLYTTTIAALQLQISADETALATLAQNLADYANQQADAQNQLAQKNSYCQQSEDQYTENFTRANHEVEIIEEVKSIVENRLNNLPASVSGALYTGVDSL